MDYLQGRSGVAYEAAGGPYEDYARCATGRYCYQCAYSAFYFAISFESLYGGTKLANVIKRLRYQFMVVQLKFPG